MLLHRTLLIAIGVLIFSHIVLDGMQVTSLIIMAIIPAYLVLIWLALRLASEMEVEATPIPFWLIYVFGGGLGLIVSFWLDREAAKRLDELGGTPGFLDFQRG
jgi:lipid-A-disaccharide synthase-like uncharacterized protein